MEKRISIVIVARSWRVRRTWRMAVLGAMVTLFRKDGKIVGWMSWLGLDWSVWRW